jgi:hypothetical protein
MLLLNSAGQFMSRITFLIRSMNINQVHSFTISRKHDDILTRLRVNPFSTRGDSDAFIFERVTRRGDLLNRFDVMKTTAELALRSALKLHHSRPDLISVEITKLSTGTFFNHPAPCV